MEYEIHPIPEFLFLDGVQLITKIKSNNKPTFL